LLDRFAFQVITLERGNRNRHILRFFTAPLCCDRDFLERV
jgi:hypothetical protein